MHFDFQTCHFYDKIMFSKLISILNEKVEIPLKNEISLFIKREDKTHPEVSGNKFRKLKYNIQYAVNQGFEQLLTFGGAYSNHLVATAKAGQIFGIKTIGVVRGDEVLKSWRENPSLLLANQFGMEFYFTDRQSFREKNSEEFISKLKQKFGDFYLVPEGGTNELAIRGTEEILTSEDVDFQVITLAVGTGGTIAGVINSSAENQKILGFPALQGDFLKNEISKYTKKQNWELITDYNLGGYAKINSDYIDFLNDFYKKTNIPLDPIYTGKMIFGLFDLIEKDFFAPKTKILAIHTGGLQGILGINQRLKSKNQSILIYENEVCFSE